MPEIRLINMTAITEQLRVIEQNDKLTDAQKFRLAEFVIVSAPTIEPEVNEPKTNGDRIHAMSDEELAAWLTDGHDICDLCQFGTYHPEFECEPEVKEDATDRCRCTERSSENT